MKWIVLALLIVCATQAFAKRCQSGDDCDEGECCVNYVIVSLFGGHCQKMRQEGESCTPLIKDNDEPPKMYHFQCPCQTGLECIAKHEVKIGDHIIKHRPECRVPGDEDDDGKDQITIFPEPEAE